MFLGMLYSCHWRWSGPGWLTLTFDTKIAFDINFWVILGHFGSFWGHSGVILGSFWGNSLLEIALNDLKPPPNCPATLWTIFGEIDSWLVLGPF